MTVRLDKGIPAERTAATHTVNLNKPDSVTGGASGPGVGAGTPDPVDLLPLPHQDRTDSHEAPSGTVRFGRPALVAAFIVGALLAGGAGAAVATTSASQRSELRTRLAASQADNKALDERLATATHELTDTTAQLEDAQGRINEIAARENAVTSSEASLTKRSAELDNRQAALDARSKRLDADQAALGRREAALNSPDVGHPLAETIDADGTWVVGRDIKAGTWTTAAYDTGCTWKVSDGRSGAGDGSYEQMEVTVRTGQKFTVHGCTLWSNFTL